MNLNNFIKDMEPIFICGHRKSGTTMLLNIFDNHHDLLVYPHDINIFYTFEYYFKHKKIFSKKRIYERLEKVIFNDLNKKKEVKKSLSINKFKKLFFEELKNKDLNIKNILNVLMLSFAQISKNYNNKVICKETSLEIYFEEILKIWPKAKFIQIIRDPRDNVSAIMDGLHKRYKKFGDSRESILFSSIFRIGLSLEMGNFYKKNYKTNFKQIKFENLVQNPKKEIKILCNFLKIDFKKIQLAPSVLGNQTKSNSYSSKRMTKISKVNVNNWKKRITTTEAHIIENQLYKFFKIYNYNLNFNHSKTFSSLANYYNNINYEHFYFDRFK